LERHLFFERFDEPHICLTCVPVFLCNFEVPSRLRRESGVMPSLAQRFPAPFQKFSGWFRIPGRAVIPQILAPASRTTESILSSLLVPGYHNIRPCADLQPTAPFSAMFRHVFGSHVAKLADD